MPQVVPAQKRAQDPRRVLANLFFACQMIPLAVGAGRDEVPWPPSSVFLGKAQDQGAAAIWAVMESSRKGEGCALLLSKCLGALPRA